MFYVIKNNVLIEYGDSVNKYWDYPNDAQELKEVSVENYNENKDSFSVVNGELVDITSTEEYLLQRELKENEKLKNNLKNQIEELDLKRIRAIAEPEIKDGETGETWLEYYTIQVQALRTQLTQLD